ncbi:hypothetical protein EUTSA_v10021601mg [Eutrema salsugineum]|uniref:Pectinesterase inhibitor domain-containing protein n=2 Tax=Eutrema salsugineum TaxID=72664 RepID=V4M782_EUTSA|nr:hypothetical protein EUTSA_v10021601mg [Eutrema salsugineum]
MAFSYVKRNIFSILPILVLLSITPLSSSFSPNDKVTKELVNQLCSQPTIYKHFCVAWLNSDPKTFTLDLHGLMGMVIEKTELLGYKNLAMMKGLARTTTDPNLKIPYGSCVTDYESSIKAIEGAKGFASSKEYLLATKATFEAFNTISDCEALLEQQPIPAYVSPRNLMFERMCNIDTVFTNLLAS